MGDKFHSLPGSAIMRSQVPNRTLRGLLAEAGWTEDFLARQVNAVAAESGMAMWLDRRSVTHWLAGRRPRPPLPELIAEALSRGLGRTVGVADLGLSRPAAPASAPTAAPAARGDAVSMLARLAQAEGGRRQVLSVGAYSVAALAIPGWAQAVARLPAVGAACGVTSRPVTASPAQRLDVEQVVAAEQMTQVFSEMDTAFGGGRARGALARYLAFDVAPWLRTPCAPALRRRLLSAVTELTYLAAFMCFDDENHGLGQRYYRAALELAAENNDPAGYAVVLRGLSVQARSLGHHQQASQLAETAARTARGTTGPARQAFFLGQVAVAAAATGARHDALTALSAAQRRLDRASSAGSGNPAMGCYHPASLAHQQAAVQALLGDRKGAIAALTESIRHRPPHERRARALTHARLAELHLGQGHLEQAVTAWHAFLDDYPQLTCGRVTSAMRVLRSRLRPLHASPTVRQLLARTTT